MVKGKARAAGSFLGGIANNPGIVILGLALGGLFIFRDKISEAFAAIPGAIGGGLGDINIQLPEINFPTFEFPEFKFPSFDFLGAFAPPAPGTAVDGAIVPGQTTVPGGVVTIPPGQTVDPDTGIVQGPPPTIVSTTGKGTDITTLFGELRPQVFDTLVASGLSFKEAAIELRDITTIQGLGDLLNKFNLAAQVQEPEIAPPAAPVAGAPFLPAGFEGGGVSFIGGSIFETPIANLSLSQIIDKFSVTASQAANILAIAKDDFGDFPFGTNTGQGIGSVFTSIPSLLPNLGAVSDPQFSGLSATEIANILTGGNISNF